MKIKILELPAYKKGSGRAKWFTAIKRYNGKPVEAFLSATTKKPPVHGEGESRNGWIRYFEWEEVIGLID